MRTLAIGLLFGAALAAQIGPRLPGQYPPGQYPPGQYPPGQGTGGPGLPMPGRGSKKSSQDPAPVPKTYSGVIRKLEDKSIEIESTDTRILTIQITEKTTKPDGLKKGDGVDVDATQDKDGQYQAVSIKRNQEVAKKITPSLTVDDDAPQPSGKAASAEPAEPDLPTTIVAPQGPLYDDGDGGPPKLKRGIPKPKPESKHTAVASARGPAASAVAPEPAAEAPEIAAAPNPRQEFIEKARAAATSFVEGLPNYICQEVVTRYASETRVPNWSVVDVVSAELVYEDHKESYRNVAINGKATKKSPQDTGAWSTGEFGTILASLFAPWTAAEFRFVREETVSHHVAEAYDFKVERVRSNWKVTVPGQYIVPAYKGTVWVDKETHNTLRIEMQAREIPEEFPKVAIESAEDYDYISLGTPEKFLLPVRAEILSCTRGSSECEKNVIEFRNYHKFSGESTIKFSQ